MRWKRPDHTWWLGGCLAGLLIAIAAGGFSLPLVLVFVVIFGAGAMLIGLDGRAVQAVSAEQEPETCPEKIPAEQNPAQEIAAEANDAGEAAVSADPGEDAAPGVRPSGDASPT